MKEIICPALSRPEAKFSELKAFFDNSKLSVTQPKTVCGQQGMNIKAEFEEPVECTQLGNR